ncbi:MAG: hypothetical protein GY697_08220 [Desulfobacterales bacterium]|nr:hypothetical protein [Desulfobacterales bacterium]
MIKMLKPKPKKRAARKHPAPAVAVITWIPAGVITWIRAAAVSTHAAADLIKPFEKGLGFGPAFFSSIDGFYP